MKESPLFKTLKEVHRILASADKNIGSYNGYISTGKGITLKTSRTDIFLYHSLIHKLINYPDSVTRDELRRVTAERVSI